MITGENDRGVDVQNEPARRMAGMAAICGRAQAWARESLQVLGEVLDRQPALALTLLLVLYAVLVILEAHTHPLSSDEIYTLRIARAPTLRDLWGMEREIDLHPPLHYLLVRQALHLPGPLWLVARVPSMVAGALATAMLFRLTARRLGSVLGIISVALLWTGPVEDFFWSDRPYMVWMALLTTLIYAYLWAVRDTKRWWPLAVVFLLSALMISDQLIGVASLGAFAVAEGVRARQRKRLSPGMAAALFLPVGIAFGFSYQLRHLAANGFPPEQIPSVGWAAAMYNAQVTQMFFVVSVTVVVGAYFWPGLRAAGVVHPPEPRPQTLPAAEGALFLGLIAVPAALMIVAALFRLQYWERYSACSVIGFAGMVPWMIYRRLTNLAILGPLLVLIVMATTVAQAVGDAGVDRGGPDRVELSSLDTSLPIVVANPMTFTEMADREPPQTARRIFYLTDRAEAERIAGYTLFENEDKIVRILGLPSHAQDARVFYAEHASFWLVANPANRTEWLLRSLLQRGATLAWKGKIRPGYDDSDLYLVTEVVTK